MIDQQGIKIAYYGDDFTGSTDALEFLSRAGLRTILFLENPDEYTLLKFGQLDAVGIAGMTRAMIPDEMEKALKEAFGVLKNLQPDHVHYKVCSTFDSSPEIGNIGTAVQVGQRIFENTCTPIVVAAPHLGRYSAFGNLFARMGIGSQGQIHRLDRHPSMSKHPTTPAHEADLRKHLAAQWDCEMGLVDLVDLESDETIQSQKLESLISEEKQVIFFDGMYNDQMKVIGNMLEKLKNQPTLFSVGSSGVSKALGDHWQSEGLFTKKNVWPVLEESQAILVLSGSCSPVTAAQIDWAEVNGFETIEIGVECLENPLLIAQCADQIASSLVAGKSVILHTCKGPDDPRISQTIQYFKKLGLDQKAMREQTAIQFGNLLGTTALEALKEVNIERLVIAGGDTSSFVARALGIEAVEMIAPLYSGAPMCRAFAPGSPVDGIEVNLKGGQVGDEAYFEKIRLGKI